MLSQEHQTCLLQLSQRLANREITQQQLASATGVHQSQISRILSGRVCRASKNVLKLCSYADSLDPKNDNESNPADDINRALKTLLNKSAVEDRAFLDVIGSLMAWRATWGTGR